VKVIEWGDRIDEVLPVNHLTVRLRYPENTDAELDQRVLEFCSPTSPMWRDQDLRELLARWSA